MKQGSAARWVAAIAAACCALPALAFDLAELMAMLQRNQSGEATFVEQRFVKGLDAPLTASGTLSFAAPDRFTRRTLKPREESMVVEGNTVTMSRSGRSRRIALDAAPEMVGLVEAVRSTLTGNGQTLERYFRPDVSGNAERWTLDLVPLEPRFASQVSSVRVGGTRSEVRSIEMQLGDGDHSLMVIEPVRLTTSEPAKPPGAEASRP
ncbi:outer membrane lipoprotein carrier protein LolA [Piscinibacter sp.]|uniref:outer membrane lipoprotein carrier protein LolA n=1 Tax=Piscinibacter sp. TaxID=1903157 RepID=UPI002BE34750|nr:outer membrane lipoprotein carrier protein LolA [Albitalea sp.]HUG21956.1 outer membrane lipoprotein carrier protein LolA [Albitalea sp.]